MRRRPNPPPEELPDADNRSGTEVFWPLFLGVLTGLGFRFVFGDATPDALNVMMASFTLLVPIAVGAVTVFTAELSKRRTWRFYFWSAAIANMLFVMGTFIILVEGLICTILAAPLFAIIGGVAGLVTGAVCRRSGHAPPMVLSVTALPLLGGVLEHHSPLPDRVDTVTTVRVVNASPEQLWQAISLAEDIRPEELDSAWMYRIGVPLPHSAITVERADERVRHIEMGKDIAFDQVIVEWEPARRVRYTYRFTADSFPPRALDDHVRIGGDYFDLLDTEYSLEPVPGGTRMTARMGYRVSTNFNWYARFVARVLVGNFETTAIEFYARRAKTAAIS
jgi:uncharacterized protein YndB with AHSA1/START domain